MHQRDRLATIVAVVTLAVAVGAVGGAHRWAICVTAALAVGASALLVLSTRRFESQPPLLWFLGACAVATLVQLIPLPAGLVETIAPATHALVMSAADVLSEPHPRWIPLTLDPPGTMVELVKLCGYVAFGFVCIRVSASQKGRRALLTAVATIGTVTAIVGLVHHALGAQRLFGLYSPEMDPPPYLSPLLNPNHFSGLLAMTAALTAGLALHHTGRRRLIWIVALAIAIGTTLLLESRGGVIALAAGLAATLGVYAAQTRQANPRESTGRQRTSAIAGGIIVACALSLVVVFTAKGITTEFAETDRMSFEHPASKFGAWRSASVLVRDHAWTGVGRGAFEPAFTRVHIPSSFHTYSHVENEYLQAALDWGLPIASGLALLMAWCVVAAAKNWRDTAVAAGAIGAVFAIALQSLADFGMELPGVAMPAIAIMATLTYVSLSAGDRRPRRNLRRAAPQLAALALAVGAIALAASPFARTVREDRARLSAIASSEPRDSEAAIAAARDSVRRHPADYYAPAIIARLLFDARDRTAVQYANHALTLHPSHAGVHHLAARMLYSAGQRDQALIEYALAVYYTIDPTDTVRELLKRYPAPDQAVLGLPSNSVRAELLLQMLRRAGRHDVRFRLAKRVLDNDPDHLPTLLALAESARHLEAYEAAENAALRANALAPSSTTAAELSDVYLATNRFAMAAEVLERALELPLQSVERHNILLGLAEAYRRDGRLDDAKGILSKILDDPASIRSIRILAHRRLAGIESALGNPNRARWEEQRANELDP